MTHVQQNQPATAREREQLRQLVRQWNENRLDLFNLSEPNENLEFHGVMRFYFKETGERVATKCVRVSSTATTRAVIEALIEKFHPDLKMLTTPEYTIWEVHENGDERQLAADEKPLLVQLNWHKDDREGRFLLRRDGALQYLPLSALQLNNDISGEAEELRRGTKRYSKREKREMKKRHQREQAMILTQSKTGEAEEIATQLYQQLPTNTFTRTISNPEVVMKKRRERKLETKLKEIGSGGSLKIHGADLDPHKPYVTLLVSIKDRASHIIRQTIDKYGLERASVSDFVLVEMLLPSMGNEGGSLSHLAPIAERQLDEDECPLLALASRPLDSESVLFSIRRRSEHRRPRSAMAVGHSTSSPTQGHVHDPCLMVLNPDSSEPIGSPRLISINANVTEIGSDRQLAMSGVQSIPLDGPYVQPRHCVIAFMDGVVTVTPSSASAEIQVNGHQITQTTILRDRLGYGHRLLLHLVFQSSICPQENRGAQFNRIARSRSADLHSNDNRAMSNDPRFRAMSNDPRFRAMETVFSVDGHIETTAIVQRPRLASSLGYSLDHQGAISPSPSLISNGSQMNNRECLPAIVEVFDSNEERFLNAIIRDLQPGRIQFKLAPVYLLYMAYRYRLSMLYQPPGSISIEQRTQRLSHFLFNTVARIRQNVQEHSQFKEMQAMWMSNAAELLNFVRLDRDLLQAAIPSNVVSGLSEIVENAFGHLCACIKQQIQMTMHGLLNPDLDDVIATSGCLSTLGDAMRILRDCRLNAALTIQLYSQLFHFINMYLFNWLVSIEGAVYCSRAWGVRLAHRLSLIHAWAEQQGLELAAECHLDRIVQAARLLHTPKTIDCLGQLGATCYKLNSYQIRNLLGRYLRDVGEPELTEELVENVARIAESQADEMARADQRAVLVEEDVHLHLPFLIPDDGYSPELVRGIPPSLSDLVNHLQQQGICRLLPQPGSSGTWTTHLRGGQRASTPSDAFFNAGYRSGDQSSTTSVSMRKLPDLVQISFPKTSYGIGLSIVAAQGVGDREVGIYVKKVVPGSAAAKDGRLEAGDHLLSVNGESLIGVTQEQAAEKMARCGNEVSFKVSKQAARYNGLATWLCAPQTTASHNKHSATTISQPQPQHQPQNQHLQQTNGTSSNYVVNGSRSSMTSLQSSVTLQNGHSDTSRRYLPGPGAVRTADAQPIHRAVRSASTSELYGQTGFAPPAQYANLPSHYRSSTNSSPHHRPTVVQPGRTSPSILRQMAVASPTSPSILRQMAVASPTSHLYRAQQRQSPSLTLTDYQNLPLIDQQQQQQQQQRHHHRTLHVPSTVSPIRSSPRHSSSSTISPPQEPITVTEPYNNPGAMRIINTNNTNGGRPFDNHILQVESQMQRLLNEELDDVLYRRSMDPVEGSSRVKVNGRESPQRAKTDSNGNMATKQPQPYLPFMHEMEQKLSSDQLNGGLQNKPRKANQYETLIDDVHDAAESLIEQDIQMPSRSEEPEKRRSPPDLPKKKAVQFKDSTTINTTPIADGKYLYEEEAMETPKVRVLGAQEIYRDPRQRRLHEIEVRQQSTKPNVDGAALGFRDKMRLFAQQIGEQTPKDRYKTSSAQREIEQDN